MRAKLTSLKEESRHRRHWQVIEQYNWLCSVLRGHYRYYGAPTNYRSLVLYRRRVKRMWHTGLQRRSQQGRWTRA